MYFLTNISNLLALSVTLSGVYGAAMRHVHRQPSLVCYEDNVLRTLERFQTDAVSFCPSYLKSPTQPVPSNLAGWPASRLSSACTCFEKTVAPAGPASTPTTPKSVTSTSSVKVKSTTSSKPVVVSKTSTSSKLTLQTKPASIKLTATTSSTSPTSTVGNGSSGGKPYTGGKRGLVYDYNSHDYSKFYKDSTKIAFGSNWNVNRSPAPGVTLDEGAFVPTIRVDSSLKNDGWSAAVKALISSGTSLIFASNEPDNASQANLSPADAATVFKNFLLPFKGQASLASPAITNGGGATGLGYLEKFVAACDGCVFDIINVHHYVQRSDVNVDQAVSAVKSYLTNDVPAFMAKHSAFQNAKICLGEFWLWGASDDEGAAYLTQLLPWLDSNSNVACYQAFGGLWEGNFINSAGTGLSKNGQVYHDL